MARKAQGTDATRTQIADPPKRRPGRPRLLEPSAEFVARKEEILTTAVRVFQKKGYDAGTLDDVADALDLRRASLYYYVHSKANLLYMIFDQAMKNAMAEVAKLKMVADPTQRLEGFIRFFVREATTEPGMFTVVYDYRNRLEDEYKEQIQAYEVEVFSTLEEAVRDAQAAGSINGTDVHYTARAIFGLSAWPYKWYQSGRDDPEQIADASVALVMKPRRSRRKTNNQSRPPA